MKKLLSIVFCAAAVSAFGEETAERTADLGTVGVTAITSSLSNTIVAVSYDDLTGGSGIVVSNFVKTANLTKGDQLAIFNNGEGTEIYDTWVLTKNENGVLYWAKNDKTFYVDANGLHEGEGTSASIVTNAVGTGIWLVRQKPVDDKDHAIPFYIYGKPVSDPVSRISANTWTLVGNPLQGSVTIGSSTVSGVQTGDQIVTANEDGKLHYYTFIGSSWSGSIAIAPGIGFWIKTQADTTITWTTSKE